MQAGEWKKLLQHRLFSTVRGGVLFEKTIQAESFQPRLRCAGTGALNTPLFRIVSKAGGHSEKLSRHLLGKKEVGNEQDFINASY